MSASIGNTQILQTLTIYTSDINSVDFAGNCILVTGSGDKRVRVWEWQRDLGYVEAFYSPLMGHKYGVTSVKVSPQSTMLASASIDGTTNLWNLRTGAKIHTMVQAAGEAVRVCRFSPDSTLLVTAGDNGQVCLWDLIYRKIIRCFQQHEGAIQSMCFSPDSCWLVTSCTFGVLKLFSSADLMNSCPSNSQAITVLATVDDAHDLGVVCCDFSISQEVADNEPLIKLYQLVTCGNDHVVKLWKIRVTEEKCDAQSVTASINLCRIMEKHSSALTCVRFSSNGSYIASSSLDKTTVIWETNTGKIITVLTGHNRYVACCAFSRDGNLIATGSNDKSVMIWDLTGNLSLSSELTRHCGTKLHRTDENGKSQGTLQEQEVMKQAEATENEVKLIWRLDDHDGAVNAVDFCGNRLIASGSGDKLVRVWDVVPREDNDDEMIIKFEEKNFSPLETHKYSVNHVEFSPCGTMLASCSLDGTTIIWDTEVTGQVKASFVNSGSAIRVARWSPNGITIATAGDDEKTTLWNVETTEELRTFEGHADAITSIAFTPDSHYLVTACSEGTWRLFDIAVQETSSSIITCEEGHDLGVQGCDFSPTLRPSLIEEELSPSNNKHSYLLATCGNDSLVKLWHIIVSDKTHIKATNSPGMSIDNVAYKERRTLEGHGGNVMSVRFSPIHGEILGSVATDKTARLWSIYSGACLHVMENHNSLVTACAFSKDTSLFITGALDKTVLIWKLPKLLVSQGMLTGNLRHNRKKVADWATDEISKWFNEIGLPELADKIQKSSLKGRHLLSMSREDLIFKLQIEDDQSIKLFEKQLYWLKCEDNNLLEISEVIEIPYEFLCPITHEIMKEPVQCSDGFTYEKAAIKEWFLSGKYTSPMTNAPLYDTSFTLNFTVRNAICTLLYGDGQ